MSLSPASSAAISADSRSARGDEAAEVVGQPVARLHAAAADLRVGPEPDQVEAARDVEAPALEALVVLDGHAEHLADDVDGDRVGELLDEVHRARCLDAVEEPVHDLRDARAQRLDHARGERLADEAARQ